MKYDQPEAEKEDTDLIEYESLYAYRMQKTKKRFAQVQLQKVKREALQKQKDEEQIKLFKDFLVCVEDRPQTKSRA